MYFSNPSMQAGWDTRLIFKWSLAGLNSEFLSSRPVVIPSLKSPVSDTFLPIVWDRIIGFIPYLMVLVLCEMQTALTGIWTQVALSIYHDDIHYTTSGDIKGIICGSD